jgi:hypothetical protein
MSAQAFPVCYPICSPVGSRVAGGPDALSGPQLTTGVIAANRTQLPSSVAVITAPFTSRRSHWAHPDGAITNLKFIDIGWGYNAGASTEANLGTGTRTIKKFVEYPVGTFTQVTWGGGNTTVNIAPGGQVVSDPVAVTIPAGVQFFERTVETVSATVPIIEMPAAHDTLGLPDGNVAGSDLGNSGTVPQGSTVSTIGSSAILGDVAVANAISFVGFGDSVFWGQGDISSVGSKGESGWVRRGLRYPCVFIGRSGQSVQSVVSVTTKLTAFKNALGFSHVINQFGINDLASASRSQAQLLADFQTLYGLVSGKFIYQCTIGPRTDTTDAWATVANQTVRTDGTWSLLTSINTAIRAGLANVTGVIEWADAAMTARNSGKWRAPPIWTTDGTHPNSLAAASIPAYAFNGLFGTQTDTTAPTITSSASPSQAENSTFNLTLLADEYIPTWAIVGGADQALFSLTGNVLSMTAKDFEIPIDANADNVYVVQVRATDVAGNNSTTQTINVTITDVGETYTFTNIEAANYVAAMTVTPNDTRKALIDTLIGGLKTDGVWSLLRRLNLFAAHDSQAGLLDAIDLTTYVTNNLSVAFDVDGGFRTNGTTNWLDYGEAPHTGFGGANSNVGAIGVYINQLAAANGVFGQFNAAFRHSISASNVTAGNSFRSGTTAAQAASTNISPAQFTGHRAQNRIDDSNAEMYGNGSVLFSGAVAWSANGAFNGQFGRYSTTYVAQRIACYWKTAGVALTGTQMANLHSRIHTYMTAIGANY